MYRSRTYKAAVLGSGRFLASVAWLLTFVVLSRVLDRTDYAAYRQTLLVYTVMAPLLTLGLSEALYYFIPRDREKSRSMLTGNILLLFGMGLFFLFFLCCGGNKLIAERFKNPELAHLLFLFSPYAVFALPSLAISACLVSMDRVKALTVYNVSSRIAVFACVMIAVFVWGSVSGAIGGTVAGAFVVFLPAMFLMYRAVGGRGAVKPEWTNVRAQLKYSVPLGLATFIGIISINLDKILVSSLTAPREFAVYANGAIEIPLISVITGSVMAILIPEFSSLYKEGKRSDIIQLWHGAMKKCALIIFPIFVFLFIMAPEVIRVLFSERYAESVYPFRVYLLLLPIRITQFGAIFMASGKNKLILYRSSIGICINFMLSVLLIKSIGPIGAAIATVLVIYLWAVTYNIVFIRKILSVDIMQMIPVRDLGRIMLISLIAAVILLAGGVLRGVEDLGTVLILGMLYFSCILLLFDRLNLVNIKSLLLRLKGEKI